MREKLEMKAVRQPALLLFRISNTPFLQDSILPVPVRIATVSLTKMLSLR